MAEQARWLELAGIRIRVESAGGLSGNTGILSNFLTEEGPVSHRFFAEIAEQMEPCGGTEVYASGAVRVYRSGDAIVRYIGEVAADPAKAYIRVIRRGQESWAQYKRSALQEGITAKLLLNAMDLPHLLTVHNGFLIHSAFIEYNGRAILFTAPSETGKSTQAQLWCDHMGAKLMNGDRAAVRIVNGQVLACGVPFSGSSPVRKNAMLPLGAIVYLSQAPENTIVRLRGVRAFRRVWEGCTVDVWDREDVELATETVAAVVGKVPVYHLSCTPDIRAVELLKNTMEVEK